MSIFHIVLLYKRSVYADSGAFKGESSDHLIIKLTLKSRVKYNK